MNITRGTFVGLLTGICLGLAGFFLSVHGGKEMGIVLFIATPFITGFAIALVTQPKEGLLSVLVLTLLISMTILLFTQLEGLLCCILSSPVLIASMGIGAGIGILLRRKTNLRPYDTTLRILILLILPLLLQGADTIERPTLLKARTESFTDSIILNTKADKVWKLLSSIDQITVPKPWPMYVGLYQPLRCTISAQKVGATRICYFTEGAIYERVTVWEAPKRMHLEIIKSTLPGRPWMGYIDANYKLIERGNTTELIRTTTITSKLAPEWYWQTFERIGVHTEHEYLFAEIKKRIEAS